MPVPTIPNTQEGDNKFKYYAFISYKREDEEWAIWLQHKLEHYKLPSNLNGRTDLPKEIRPVFKDTSELNPGNLPQQIHEALEQSSYLIVICSPRSAKSEWVNREVETFIGMGRTDKIIPFIIDGNAFSKNPETECFPSALCNLPAEQEILGANINEMGRDAAAVKVVAQMFVIRFDELWQRYEREQRKKRRWIIVASIVGFLAMAGVAFWMYTQRQQTLKANWQMMENQARFIAKTANGLVDEGDSYTAQRLLLEVMPKDLEHQDRPYTPDAEAAFREACEINTAILKGHTDKVESAAFSPDGKRIVSSSEDGTIRIWETETGTLLDTIIVGTTIYSVSFSSDGSFIVSATNCAIIVWDLASKQPVKYLPVDNDLVESAYFSPDGSLIVSATIYKGIIIWDVASKQPVKNLLGRSAAFSPNGKLLIVRRDSLPEINEKSINVDDHHVFPIVEIWDIASGHRINKMNGRDASFSADSKQIVAVSSGDDVCVWDAFSGLPLKTMKKLCDFNVCSPIFSPDGKFVAAVEDWFYVRIWDVESGNSFKIISLSDHINSIAFSPDGSHILSVSSDGNVSILDSGLKRLYGPNGIVKAYNPDRQQIATKSDSIRIWEAETGVKKQAWKENEVKSMSFSPNGDLILSVMDDDESILIKALLAIRQGIISNSDYETVKVWDAKTGQHLYSLNGYVDYAISAAFSPDGKQIVSISKDHTLRFWDAKSGQEIRSLDDVNGTFVAFCPDGNRIITIDDKIVNIYDVTSGQPIQVLEGHLKEINSAIFSPDGKRIATTSDDNTVRVWDLTTGNYKMFMGHNGVVNYAAFSPNGKYLVSASSDRTIKVWDIDQGWLVETISFIYSVKFAAFSTDGNRIITADYEGGIRILDFPPLQELIDQTRERFKNRPLTPEERRMYYLE